MTVAYFCEHGDELSDSVKGGKVSDYLGAVRPLESVNSSVIRYPYTRLPELRATPS